MPSKFVGDQDEADAILAMLELEEEPVENEWQYDPVTGNVFCATGAGGGVDPTCSPGGGKQPFAPGGGSQKTTAPPPAKAGEPLHDPSERALEAGKAARVGVDPLKVPPPPTIGRLPNLTPHERGVETAFIKHYENNPDQVAADFRDVIRSSLKPGEAPTYGTDDAKVLADAWSHPDIETRAKNRATLNLALHQTANAITKRAFLQELDTLKAGDELLVTVGGCGAGKGYALKNVPQALELKQRAKAVWDSAGDQNATENQWIQQEAEKRGLKVNYVFVHADPKVQWADPGRGVVARAADPKDGRMVDAHVFADSYALGVKNHAEFVAKHQNNPSANFVFLDNRGKPSLLPSMPTDVPSRDELLAFAHKTIAERTEIPEHVKQGATAGQRIWGQ